MTNESVEEGTVDVRAHMTQLAEQLAPLCRHISVRDDEHGAFLLAVSKDDTRSLELRKIDDEYLLELWAGQAADDERLEEESRLEDVSAAVGRASAWLKSGAA